MSIQRREFLSLAAAAAGGMALSGRTAFAKETRDFRIAVIGVNGRGWSHLDALAPNVVAICDVDSRVAESQAARFKKHHGRQLDLVVDYRDLLQRGDIDAVTVATPNHTHSLIGIAAIQAGKHLYVEKPVSHNVWEGRQLVAKAEQSGLVCQCGTQSRSSEALQQAVAWVRGGGLGKIQYALGTCYKPRPSIGRLDQPLVIPNTIDYDLWCGPAEKADIYRPRLHYDWHWDFNTGAGDTGNQGIHQMDVARWFLGYDSLAPRTISFGGRLGYDDAGNTPNSQVVFHDYPDAPLIFETRGLPRCKAAQSSWDRSMDKYRGSQIGVIVQCEDGHVYADSSYNKATAYDRDGKIVKEWHGGGNHFKNWLNAAVAGDASGLNAPVRQGHLSSSLCHVGNVSHRVGQPAVAGDISASIAGNDLLSQSFDRMAAHLRANDVDIDSQPGALVAGSWVAVDPETEQFVGNPAAAALWKRAGRDDFRVPDVLASV
ncbi:MAG: Gfo/Idh/MocA family oxidoreductase [Planctomycetales bacterium]|nr:Gfo/Idh/MocA family oxidoreductase [Planctomycetales bacterium]